jgi:two-component system response regulator AtoC
MTPPPAEESMMHDGTGSEYLTQYAPLLGNSPPMLAIRNTVEQVADTSATVLICGESGVGKEVIAKAIHLASPRHPRPFVKVNCAALPSELLESELFGHEKGAFTGAYRRKLGKFEVAHEGSILLDEIGEMPIGLQAKLLHVLQDQQFARVGGSEVIRTDVRVIASTNRHLEQAIADGCFREDLYYRLKVVLLHVPPLRERREEIPILVRAFLGRFNAEFRRRVTLSPEALQLLSQYAWPGNVRELENMVKRSVVLEDELLPVKELARPVRAPGTAPPDPSPPVVLAKVESDGSYHANTLRAVVRQAALDAQRRAIEEVLERVHWNRAEAARRLKISYKGLLYKMDQCGLSRKRSRRLSA